ncbi:inosine monophosphate dehydrogenase [Neofusicoccum parvum]|uniref:Inosine monophosphate dehydrogenase n=1 Tax=Neofusicoccum parvum TaxID=310453 RepID=A0ACB5SHK2_9PEZI|nr:inosine monophosphate dehydrogenase [Neofusicoccum parvum]
MSSPSSNLLHKWFPHTTAPFICNAPMFGAAGPELAAAVTLAGGFGFIGGGFAFAAPSPQPAALSAALATARSLLSLPSPTTPLPLGVGLLTLTPTDLLPAILPILAAHRPAAVWLFAPPSGAAHAALIPALRDAGREWGLRVVVQVGSVAAAREAAGQGADGVVAQGVDAGGHQWARGAGVVALVPEVADMLAREFAGSDVALLAAGGVADGRGVAAALALGAHGVVMGTRFLVAEEAATTGGVREVLVGAKDGGGVTVKGRCHDGFNGTAAIWPDVYDGRAVVGRSYREWEDGVSEDEVGKRLKESREKGNADAEGRTVVWAGTGVGLIDRVMPAGEIVKEVQAKAREVVQGMQKL